MKQGDDHLVPHTGLTEGTAGPQAAAQVTLLAVLQDDVQLRPLVHGRPEGHDPVYIIKLTVQLDLLMHLLHGEGETEHGVWGGLAGRWLTGCVWGS